MSSVRPASNLDMDALQGFKLDQNGWEKSINSFDIPVRDEWVSVNTPCGEAQMSTWEASMTGGECIAHYSIRLDKQMWVFQYFRQISSVRHTKRIGMGLMQRF